MAKARLYVYNGRELKGEVKGQAAVVLDVLKRQNGEPKLASDIAEQVSKEGTLKTRQDVLRVVLYYIIIFKGKGVVNAVDQDIVEAPSEAPAEQPVAAE